MAPDLVSFGAVLSSDGCHVTVHHFPEGKWPGRTVILDFTLPPAPPGLSRSKALAVLLEQALEELRYRQSSGELL